jgi:dihydroorotate dehydrogenase
MPSLRPLSPLEEQTLLEQGGFSGPHLFERTVALVKRYKKLLDRSPSPTMKDGMSRAEVEMKVRETDRSLQEDEKSNEASTGTTSKNPPDSVQSSVDTGTIALRPPPDNEQSDAKQPLFNPPKERFFD